METNEEYLFECDNWLSRDYGDGEILREFAPSKEEGTLQGFHLDLIFIISFCNLYIFYK